DGATVKEMKEELEKCIPELCDKDALEDAVDALLDLLFELLIKRFGKLLEIIRRVLSRFQVGRNLLAALEDFAVEVVERIEKIIAQLQRL
ncbi:MAG: hypothetical protein L0287_01820, partial [Anaerolineae bacterium]|nr:hypothetical protein [Anaerolineae bacterium]